MLAAAILLFGMYYSQAQDPANPNQLPAIPGLSSVPAAQPPSQPEQPAAQAPMQPSTQPAAPQPPSPAVPQAQPLLTPLPPNLSGKPLAQAKLKLNADTRVKSPFMLPKEIYLSIMKKRVDVQAEGFVDMSVEAKRRWALKYYSLVAVIWNVKNPKAKIADKEGVMHTYKEKDYIGNQEGFISEINNGEVVISERGSEIRLKLKK